MSKGMPSMMALLGLLAVAGYKNKDKISDMMSSAQQSLGTAGAQGQAGAGGAGGLLGEIGTVFGNDSAGDSLSSGLNDIIEKFRKSGQADVADSWVGSGPNKPVASSSLEQTLGADTLADLSARTGLSAQEILARLSTSLPSAVDGFTPSGRLPDANEAKGFR